MARNKSCRSPLVVRRSDTLLPVSPNSEQVSESLSHNGETAAMKNQEITMGDGAQAPGHGIPEDTRSEVESVDGGDDTGEDDRVKEARVAKGKKSPKRVRRKRREKSMSLRTCRSAVGARIASNPEHAMRITGRNRPRTPLRRSRLLECTWTIFSCRGRTSLQAATRCS